MAVAPVHVWVCLRSFNDCVFGFGNKPTLVL
jgi:hypothetical protein